MLDRGCLARRDEGAHARLDLGRDRTTPTGQWAEFTSSGNCAEVLRSQAYRRIPEIPADLATFTPKQGWGDAKLMSGPNTPSSPPFSCDPAAEDGTVGIVTQLVVRSPEGRAFESPCGPHHSWLVPVICGQRSSWNFSRWSLHGLPSASL